MKKIKKTPVLQKFIPIVSECTTEATLVLERPNPMEKVELMRQASEAKQKKIRFTEEEQRIRMKLANFDMLF